MKRWLSAASMACLALTVGCGPSNEDDPSNPGGNTPGETKVPERDGIPSASNADRLLYYANTHQDAPGLYAYRPSTPDAAPIYIDPEMNVVAPFHHAVHRGTIGAGGLITDFHAGGVFYGTYFANEANNSPLPDTFSGHVHLVSAEPSPAPAPAQVSNYEIGAGMLGAYGGLFSYNLASLTGSSYALNQSDTPVRFDFSLAPDEAPVAIPKGSTLYAFLGEGSTQHEHWLHLSHTGDLAFYTSDMSSSAPVVDEGSGTPLTGISSASRVVTSLSFSDALIVISLKSDENNSDGQTGALYRISRPSAAHPGGVAKKLLNENGDPNIFGVGPFVLGRGIPREPLLYTQDNVAFFADGPGMFNQTRTSFSRADRDGWSALNNADEGSQIEVPGLPTITPFLPAVMVAVPGHGTFWAPAGKPELIEPNASAPSTWKRTPLDLPLPDNTPIFSSANGWIYYNHDKSGGGALAYHVPSKKLLSFPKAMWIGASTDGTSSNSGNSVEQTSLSEVFLYTNDRRLVAFEATKPNEGRVILGTLPASTDMVILYGPGQGPHRLLQVVHDDESAEVIAVDTRTKGSLRRLMTTPATDWRREYMLFGEVQGERVNATNTRPVSLF